MPDYSSKLEIPLPLGTDLTSRSAYRAALVKIDDNAALDPFILKQATYNSGSDRIEVTIGKGRASFLDTLVNIETDSVVYINTPTINADYYLYLKNDETFVTNTVGTGITGGILLHKISTGDNVQTITCYDQRGLLPGSDARAVNDEVTAHLAEKATDTDLGHVKVDDTTIIADDGVITALPVQAIGGWDGAVLSGLALDGNNVELGRPIYYKDGAEPVIWEAGTPAYTGSQSKETGYFNMQITGSESNMAHRYYVTNQPIDLTGIDELSVEWYGYDKTSFSTSVLSVSTSKNPATYESASPRTEVHGNHTRGYSTLDVSGVTGNNYIHVWLTERYVGQDGSGKLNVYEIRVGGAEPISGTFYIDHTPPNLIDYGNIFFNETIPTVPRTQTVTISVKDTSDNVLIADVQDKGALSSIDPTTYPTIRIAGTLTRANTGDESPKVGAPLISYIGTLAGGE